MNRNVYERLYDIGLDWSVHRGNYKDMTKEERLEFRRRLSMEANIFAESVEDERDTMEDAIEAMKTVALEICEALKAEKEAKKEEH